METADVEINVDNFKKILDTTNSFKTKDNHEILKPFIAVIIERLDEFGDFDVASDNDYVVMTGFDKYFSYTVTQSLKTNMTEIFRRPTGLVQN